MSILMEKLYKNLDQAVAFELSFTNPIDIYDDTCIMDYMEELCDKCGKIFQQHDYLVPKSRCKKPYGILSSCVYGVSEELKYELIINFNITEKDFRPIRNKKGEIVFYQITPQHIMLPINKENNWHIKTCPKCGSIQYSNTEQENEIGEFYYYISKQALAEMHDLNITYEHFDTNEPMCVISKRVFEFLIKRYPRSHYIPFFLKGTQCDGSLS